MKSAVRSVNESSCSLFLQPCVLEVILLFLASKWRQTDSRSLHRLRGQDSLRSTVHSIHPLEPPLLSQPTASCQVRGQEGSPRAPNCPVGKPTAVIPAGIQDVKPCCAYYFFSLGSSGSRQTGVSIKTFPLTFWECQVSSPFSSERSGIPGKGLSCRGSDSVSQRPQLHHLPQPKSTLDVRGLSPSSWCGMKDERCHG